MEKTSYNLLTNTSPVLVSYTKYLTVILSKLVTVAHQISNKLSKDAIKRTVEENIPPKHTMTHQKAIGKHVTATTLNPLET